MKIHFHNAFYTNTELADIQTFCGETIKTVSMKDAVYSMYGFFKLAGGEHEKNFCAECIANPDLTLTVLAISGEE